MLVWILDWFVMKIFNIIDILRGVTLPHWAAASAGWVLPAGAAAAGAVALWRQTPQEKR